MAKDRRVPHARLVATQVKYLARAAQKLPSYAAAQCILPPLAFEQASSEACAAHKRIGGDTVLDLTCGLGVDAFFLSRRFGRVVTLERNDVLARVAAENFSRLGATNIEVGTPPPRSISGATACISTGSTPTPTAAQPRAASWCGRRIVRPTSSP